MTPRMPDPNEALGVCRALYDFAAGIDTRDWHLYRSAFADEFELDYTSYRAGSAGRMVADDWVERAKVLFTGLDASQHSLSNPRVAMLADDHAELMMYVQAEHFLVNSEGDNWFTLGGYYADELTLIEGRWRITTKKLVVRWNRGNRHVLSLAAERGRQRLAGEAGG